VIHPDTELRFVSDEIGYGVFATAPIPRGTIVWVRDAFDRLFSRDEIEQLPSAYRAIVEKYTYVDAESTHVLCWDLAKYVNHSCRPNCQKGQAEFEVAVRDIGAGEELRSDYASLNLDQPEPFQCRCGTHTCRGTIQPEDAVVLEGEWTQSFHAALTVAGKVPQPLAPFFSQASHGALRIART
jgi:SET domain-containing protein